MKKIPEIVVVSGKGGTGKTSLTAAFAAFSAGEHLLGDCDVDAANLHLLVSPEATTSEECRYGREAIIDETKCTACNQCEKLCRFGAIKNHTIDPFLCEGCGVCSWNCPSHAIDMKETLTGELFSSICRHGPFIHGHLEPGAENCGKLVARLRERCRQEANDKKFILLDGPPGIGCPTIAALTASSFALIVTEPTPSGQSDFLRIEQLISHFRLPSALCINKHDLNTALAKTIAAHAHSRNIPTIDYIPYDPLFTQAQRQGCSVPECGPSPLATQLEKLWEQLKIQSLHRPIR